MRVLAHTETAVRDLLAEKVEQGNLTPADANRLFNWGFRIVTQTIGNWRRNEHNADQINEAIQRKHLQAKRALVTAATANARNLACRDLLLAQMFTAAWKGMQQDVNAYKTLQQA